MKTPILETDRLILRPFREDDAQDVFDGWESDSDVAKYIFWTSHNDIEKTKEWIAFEITQIEKDDWYRFALVLKETGTLIGTALIYFEEEVSGWEIGYNLGKKHWGSGYTTEAVKRIIDFAVETLGITEFVGRYAKENPASGNVMKKLGFEYEKDIPYECNDGAVKREGIQCRLRIKGQKMNIEEQFNLIAKEYDENRRRFIPCFDDYYENTTKFIAANIKEPKRILDLGAGTGLLSYYWYRNFPQAEYVLVDIADEMLNVARNRFLGLENVHCQVMDYSKELPDGEYDVIASALSIHHLEYEDKKELFARIYNKLPDGGLFINYDQFCGGSKEMNSWFDSYWESQLENSGLTEKDIELWRERRMLDRECSVEEETDMLRECGFKEVKCVYSNLKFSVIAAVK